MASLSYFATGNTNWETARAKARQAMLDIAVPVNNKPNYAQILSIIEAMCLRAIGENEEEQRNDVATRYRHAAKLLEQLAIGVAYRIAGKEVPAEVKEKLIKYKLWSDDFYSI